jgi:sirohydrochlorin ferrochelatase
MRRCIQGRGPATKLALALLLAGGSSTPLGAQTGLLVVAHGAGPEWNGRVRETVGQVRWAHGPVAVAFLMGAEADSAGWEVGVRRLVADGATSIIVVPLMVSSHGGHYREIEYYAGLRDSASDSHAHHVRRPPPVALRVAPALDGAPELGSALAERWSALAPDDRRRPVLLVAHGPNDSADAERWIRDLTMASTALRQAGLDRDLRVGLLRDDAPPAVRAAAVAELRAVSRALADGDSVVVLPVLISSGEINAQKIPRDLADLPVRYHPGPLAPSAHLARWIERRAAEELASDP